MFTAIFCILPQIHKTLFVDNVETTVDLDADKKIPQFIFLLFYLFFLFSGSMSFPWLTSQNGPSFGHSWRRIAHSLSRPPQACPSNRYESYS